MLGALAPFGEAVIRAGLVVGILLGIGAPAAAGPIVVEPNTLAQGYAWQHSDELRPPAEIRVVLFQIRMGRADNLRGFATFSGLAGVGLAAYAAGHQEPVTALVSGLVGTTFYFVCNWQARAIERKAWQEVGLLPAKGGL